VVIVAHRKHRSNVPLAEKVIGAVLLLMLGGIGVAVYVKGKHYDPKLFALDLSPPQGGSTAPSAQNLLPREIPGSSFKRSGEMESFNRDNLYEKINGRAEHFLAYGVIGLWCATYAHTQNSQLFIDLFVYDMGSPENAFGVYSSERPSEAKELSLGRQGYNSGSSFFFWKGKYYVQVLAYSEEQGVKEAAAKAAGYVEKRIHDDRSPLWGLSAFPKDGLIQSSIQFVKKNALGLDFLNDAYTAKYERDGVRFTCFLSRKKTAREASEVKEGFSNFLKQYGRVAERSKRARVELLTGEAGGIHYCVFQKGNVFGGVSDLDDKSAAQRYALELFGAVSR